MLALCAFVAIGGRRRRNPAFAKANAEQDHIVFAYAGDLSSVSRDGRRRLRLTSGTGNETDPAFSPDGTRIAFTGEYDGNVDVSDPGGGWCAEEAHVASGGGSRPGLDGGRQAGDFQFHANRIFAFQRDVHAAGGGRRGRKAAAAQRDTRRRCRPTASRSRTATGKALRRWKRYRGGQTARIWLARLYSAITKQPPQLQRLQPHVGEDASTFSRTATVR